MTRAAGVHEPVLAWYAENARDLPWRRPEATPWAILVSELMLQQTPVARVLPVFDRWMSLWPEPADLAAAPPGDAVRVWGRLGYPRRALRLHAAAAAITSVHDGRVPASYAELRSLPGVGEYTAAAVASFAFGQRHAVLDTNVRRVLARFDGGVEQPAPALTAAERRRAEALLPSDAPTAAVWAVAVMELGALVCTATRPRCVVCPVADRCAWRAAGFPAYDGKVQRPQTYAGTDRQCRGRLLAVVREAPGPVPRSALEAAWSNPSDPRQRDRCLDSLFDDGLLIRAGEDSCALP